MDGWMDGRMDGWMNGWTDKYSGTDFNCTGWLIIQTISLDSLTVSYSV